jgi:SAM-dependent methyltransferase
MSALRTWQDSAGDVGTAPHPAKYSAALLPTIHKWLAGHAPLIDPFAGVGSSGIAGLYHVEIEHEWASQCPEPWFVADARNLPFADGFFGGAVTSPCYANRMADHHVAKDKSRRVTYTHYLGRKLTPGNAGAMGWTGKEGDQYRQLHVDVWTELLRVLRPGSPFVLNVSNHIRKGEEVHVVGWHVEACRRLGWIVEDAVGIPTPRMRHGANAVLRVEHEWLILFKRPLTLGTIEPMMGS